MTVRRWGDVMSRATSSKASRYWIYRTVGGENIIKGAGRTAVATSDSSVPSYLPPGKAVWPGCERKFFDRVVSNTLNDPSFSNNKINTAARLLTAWFGLNKSCQGASQLRFLFGEISPRRAWLQYGAELKVTDEQIKLRRFVVIKPPKAPP